MLKCAKSVRPSEQKVCVRFARTVKTRRIKTEKRECPAARMCHNDENREKGWMALGSAVIGWIKNQKVTSAATEAGR